MPRASLPSIVLLSTLLPGQEPPTLLTRLDSGEPKTIAAAALAIGDAKMAKAIPALRRALRKTHEMDRNAGWYPTLAILDALVRLEADVQTAEIEHLTHGRGLPAVMILAARAPKKHERILLRVFDEQTGHRVQYAWLTAAICLTKLRSKPFAERLLSGIGLHVDVDVIQEGDELPARSGSRRGGGMSATSGNRFAMRGFPLFGVYELSGSGRKGSPPLAALGETKIYSHRRTAVRGNIQLAHSWIHLDYTRHRLEYAAALLGTTAAKLPVRQRSHETIFFRTGARYARDIARLRRAAAATVDALASRFRAAGLIDPKKQLHPEVSVSVRVTDHRRGVAHLPDLNGVTVYRTKRR